MELKYFAIIKDNKLIGIGNCPMTNLKNIEVSQEIFENSEKYMYDGENIVLDPDYEEKQKQKERELINLLSLTKREVFLALYKAKKITPDMIKAQITEPEALIEFEYANEYYRGNSLIDLIGKKLGYTSDDLDYLFQNKELPAKALEADADQAEELTPSAVNKKDLEKE